MHVLFLNSIHPSFGHSEAVASVFAMLMEAMAQQGVRVSWAVDQPVMPLDDMTRNRLQQNNITLYGDYSEHLVRDVSSSKIWRRISELRKAFFSRTNDDTPRFKQPENVAESLANSGADVVCLFWDSNFEYLIPYIPIPIVAYSAKPRYESAQVRIRNRLPGAPRNRIKRWLIQQILDKQQKRHLTRFKQIAAVTNIHLDDSQHYQSLGIDCKYISNTWSDPFGDDWAIKRQQQEQMREGINIFGSFSNLTCTGNMIGIDYWSKHIVPLLDMKMKKPWTIHVYGKGFDKLPKEIQQQLNHPNIRIRGFVDDIDSEISGNEIFLLCNNVGPYAGGYTRVIYCLASGGCMVSHSSLAESMPEVINGQNAFLCSTPEQFADAIVKLSESETLRNKIGLHARATYEKKYQPSYIASQLISVMKQVLA